MHQQGMLAFRVKIIVTMTDQLRAKFENLELNAGLGKISAFISMSLGLLCLFGALCFLFPSVMTTPELRPFYAKIMMFFILDSWVALF